MLSPSQFGKQLFSEGENFEISSQASLGKLTEQSVETGEGAESSSDSWDRISAGGLEPGDTFGDDHEYTILSLLGAGAQAQVFACRHRDGLDYAVKVFSKRDLFYLNSDCDSEQTLEYKYFERELEVLRSLDHESIVQMVKFLEAEEYFFVLMKLGQQDLHQHVERSGNMTEPQARHVFNQLLAGVGHMHSQGVLHRDLKLQNIIVDGTSCHEDGWQKLSVKIGDFGLAKKVDKVAEYSPCEASAAQEEYLSTEEVPWESKALESEQELEAPPAPVPLIRAITTVGTPCFMAPEVSGLAGRRSGGAYDKEVDYFSLGVCLYVLLTGKFPDDRPCMLRKRSRRTAGFFYDEELDMLSADVQDLLRGLTRKDPLQRFGFEDCLAHAWLREARV